MKVAESSVRTDIPIPEVKRGRKPVHRFDLLDEVGKSIWIKSTSQSIHSCLTLFRQNHQPDWRFKVKRERKGREDGVRVWRVE